MAVAFLFHSICWMTHICAHNLLFLPVRSIESTLWIFSWFRRAKYPNRFTIFMAIPVSPNLLSIDLFVSRLLYSFCFSLYHFKFHTNITYSFWQTLSWTISRVLGFMCLFFYSQWNAFCIASMIQWPLHTKILPNEVLCTASEFGNHLLFH